ncbi:MAG: aliphatic sulfonate ABC transporter substrate-binding protein [Eubacteriales bacterium]|nr:aliphatic sulfonate ABC transporter substrate-binding protein [Eubacteriales bacterium]
MKSLTLKRMLLLTCILITLPLLSVGCGKGNNEALTSINIGYFNNITHAQALLMKSEKSLEQTLGAEVTVNWTAFNAGPAEVEALFSGAVDIGYIGPVPAITANVKSKGDVQILSGATKGGAVLIKQKDSDIKALEDLSGKTVAIPQIGNTQHLCLLQLLSEHGLSPVTDNGTVTVSAVANADVANTMERGDIDAALVPEPWGATLLANGAELLLDYDQIYMDGAYDVAVVVIRKEFLQKYPEAAEAFLKEHELATKQINEHPEESLTAINEELNAATGKSLDPVILADAFTRIGVSSELNRDSIYGFAEVSKEQGFIDSLPDKDLYVSTKS